MRVPFCFSKLFLVENNNNYKYYNTINNESAVKKMGRSYFNSKPFFFLILFSLLVSIGKCDSNNTVIITYDNYQIEYAVGCRDNAIGYLEAKGACIEELGPEWSLATVPNAVANNAVKSLINTTSYTWLGGFAAYMGGWKYKWEFTPRNKVNITFASLRDCYRRSGVYCNFINNKPSSSRCNNKYANWVLMYPNGSWNNALKEPDVQCISASCYACHRFPCSQSDINEVCFAAGTLNITGYFPNCKCICKSGFGGRKCEGRLAINGNYTSFYKLKCNTRTITFSEALAACKAENDGWELATIPSENATAVVKQLITSSNVAWLAGSDVASAGAWKWMTGRLAGKQFSANSSAVNGMYVRWGTGKPRPEDVCLSQRRNYLATPKSGYWSDRYNETSCDSLPKCYLCEQSSCVFEEECDKTYSTGVTGNYGNCQCLCKDGWGGKRCNISNKLYTPTYTIEYKVNCNIAPLKQDAANKKCEALGEGWTLASAFDNKTDEKIGSLIWMNTWIAGYSVYYNLTQKYFFEWQYGRGKGVKFANELSCLPGVYCNFANGGPLVRNCSGFNDYLIMLTNKTWLDVSSTTDPDCNPTRCYACERSLCNVTADCFAPGTVMVSGYFPNCDCRCKTGYDGSKCNSFYFNVSDEYLSYYLSCSTSISYVEAQEGCHALGDGWYLGTVPNLQAKNKLSEITSVPKLSVWLAGSDAASAGEWRWMYGRLAGRQFSQGSVPISGMYTNWGTGRPRPTDTCGTQKRNYLVATSDGSWSDMYNDTRGTSCDDPLPQCYLCERSSCVFEMDCDTNHSTNVIGVFGTCMCACKQGWGGPRCNMTAVLYTANYAIEYYVGCSLTTVNYRNATADCKSIGEGWALASSYSSEINNMITSLTNTPTLLGGVKENGLNFTWKYGRGSKIAFANSTDCFSPSAAFCNFIPGRPKEKYCNGHKINLVLLRNGSWLDVSGYSNYPNCNSARCYACDRSPCNLTSDCFLTGSESVSGYYPDCKCICKKMFSGPLCDVVIVSDIYKSEYVLKCKSGQESVSFSDAKELCKSIKDGWHLATVSSSNANSAIISFGNNTAWLGGSSAGSSGSWNWLEGRLKGKRFYKQGESDGNNYTNWATGRPKEESCGNQKREYLTLSNDGTWVDSYGVFTTCANILPKCYVCERNPCVLSLDCDSLKSDNVTGYFPDCICKCREGWGGARCDLNTSVDNGGYLSEYNVVCSEDALSYALSLDYCVNLGEGWEIASVPTKAANDLITNFTSKRVWIGAVFNNQARFEGYNGKQWYWTHEHRLGAKRHFATASSCLPNSYCNFKPGESLNQPCSGAYKDRLVVNGSDSVSTRYWALLDEDSLCGSEVKCVACERSRCTNKLDCNNSEKTETVIGYYPNCKCICKYGYGGDHCNVTSLVNFGNYSSTFDVWCENSSLSYVDAKEKCNDLGSGWALATVPTNAVHEILSNFSRAREVWLAGYDENHDREWKWQSGRIQGSTFFNDTSCSNNFDCQWNSYEPSTRSRNCINSGIIYRNSLSLINGTRGYRWKARYEDKNCDFTLPKCYACERSLCVLSLDCDVNKTVNVSGYFPDCQCECVSGYAGTRCDGLSCTNEANCHGRASNVTGVIPNCTCIGCPTGYDTPDCSKDNKTIITSTSSLKTTASSPATTINPDQLCPFTVTSCQKSEASDNTVLHPMYTPSISLNGIISAGTKGIALVLPMPYIVTKYKFHYKMTIVSDIGKNGVQIFVSDTSVVSNAIVGIIVYNNTENLDDDSSFYLELVLAANLIENCCPVKSSSRHNYFKANSANDTFRIGKLTLLPYAPLPDSKNPSTYSNDIGQKAAKKLIQQASSEGENVVDYVELFGSHSDRVVLRALSPLALMIPINDDGYSGIILSNIIFTVAIALFHFFVVLIQRSRHDCTIREACAMVYFPSMPIYVIYALLPGIAVASGELVAKTSVMGFLGLVILLVVVIGSALVPYLWLSRALYEVPLTQNRIGSPNKFIFPTTINIPFQINDMYMAMIGNIRTSPMFLWPTIPVWSSVLLFVAALIQPVTKNACIALYIVLAVLHFLLVLVVLLLRPMSSLLLNVLFAVGLIPIILLSVVLASEVAADSYFTGTKARVMLILFTVTNAARLAIAVASPLRVFQFITYFNYTSHRPLWSHSSRFGKGLDNEEKLFLAPLYISHHELEPENNIAIGDTDSEFSEHSGNGSFSEENHLI